MERQRLVWAFLVFDQIIFSYEASYELVVRKRKTCALEKYDPSISPEYILSCGKSSVPVEVIDRYLFQGRDFLGVVKLDLM